MQSDEVKAAIELVLHGYKAETFGKLLMFLANEDAGMKMMCDAQTGGSPMNDMRAAVLALAKECEK